MVDTTERDDNWTLPVQDFLTHCVANVGHVLHLFKIQTHALHPTCVDFGNIIFVMLIHYGFPEGDSLACGAVFPAAEENYAVVGGCLDLSRVHNFPDELRIGVRHWPFNSMNGLVWDNLSIHVWLSLSNDTVYFDGVGQAEPARRAGDRVVQSVLLLPSFCLMERKFLFQVCHFGWISALFSV